MKPLAVAVEAALAGGRVLRTYFRGSFEISLKRELDLVTEADLASEREVISILSRRFPDAAILAEETGARPPRSGRGRFIIDPLDGTTNFAHGYPTFAVSIGYEDDGHVVAGCVYDPIRDELFTAEKGRGAFLNGARLAVSSTSRLDSALLVTGFPYDFKNDIEKNTRLFLRFMAACRAVRRDGSAALDLCYLAAGRIDGFWEEKLSPWDTAAGSLLVEEAGGSVTDFAGSPFHNSKPSVLASNRLLHREMLAVVA